MTTESATQAVVGDILTDQRLLKKYQHDPDKALDESSDRLGLKNGKILAEAKAAARVRIAHETDKVFPGLSREEATKMLLGSLDGPERSYGIFTWLNIVLFAVGIFLLVSAAVSGLVTGKEQFTALFGAGGITVLIYMFISNPLKRIANAASDHSQIRTVVFGFWIQLANWRTELLDPVDQLNYETLRDVNIEVQKAMEQACKMLQTYAESKEFTLPKQASATA